VTLSKILLYFCLSFILGIFLNSFFPNFQIFILILFIIFLLISTVFHSFFIFSFCLLFLFFGILRHQSVLHEIKEDPLTKLNDTKNEIVLTGFVSKEPEFTQKTQRLIIKVEKIFLQDGKFYSSKGKVLLVTKKYPEYSFGDRIKVLGKLQKPSEDLEGFNYKEYLQKDGIYSLINFPKVELIKEKNPPSFSWLIYGKILQLKKKLRESINQIFPFPQSSILNAMLLGDKKQITQDWKEKLNITGLRHIVVVSGLHITILTSILLNVFLALGFWRKHAIFASLIFILLLVIITGFQPSTIRAAIMGGFYLLAQYFGRMNASSRSIVFAASIMLLQNPLLLKSDIGFQLSFLATMGIIFLSPILEDFLKRIPNFLQTKSILSMTLSAQIFTLPILIYNFGYFSLVSPITNILVLPFLPWILGLGFLSGILGIFSQFLGQVFSFFCQIFLSYVLRVIEFFSQPWAFKTFKISWIWLIISYSFLGLITWWLNKRKKPI
jgi:competence protein ComEC